eukprot:419608-Rhodomonas_salina.2
MQGSIEGMEKREERKEERERGREEENRREGGAQRTVAAYPTCFVPASDSSPPSTSRGPCVP